MHNSTFPRVVEELKREAGKDWEAIPEMGWVEPTVLAREDERWSVMADTEKGAGNTNFHAKKIFLLRLAVHGIANLLQIEGLLQRNHRPSEASATQRTPAQARYSPLSGISRAYFARREIQGLHRALRIAIWSLNVPLVLLPSIVFLAKLSSLPKSC